jgi:uncharacterized damage-inducible protein DinB
MPIASEIDYLLDYTDWDRGQWEAWLGSQSPEVLALDLGAHADGRIANIGELVRHIFSAEQRYVERIQDLPVSDNSSVLPNDVAALFAFGRRSREGLRRLLQDFPANRWDTLRELQFGQHKRTITPRTMLVQSVTHEIRHWAQIATLLRLAGYRTGLHDFLVSGVFEQRLAPNTR